MYTAKHSRAKEIIEIRIVVGLLDHRKKKKKRSINT